ncbi:MAG: AlkZ family DNA glycosylase [Spirochaetales bacterium]|nr:AlkZ family DNA glycosylase [Spirochaetales bacterium]
MKITKNEACLFLANRHGLLRPRSLETLPDISMLIKDLGCIQYDPLDQAGRNADLVLQSRVRNYRPEILERLMYDDRVLVDYWDKNMSIWHSSDWPFFNRYRQSYADYHGKRDSEFAAVYKDIFAYLEKNEKICSSDIKGQAKVVWSWAPTSLLRASLEALFHSGKLIIHSKQGTRKYYAPSEKHLPSDLLASSDPFKNEREYYAWHVRRRIRSVGMLANGSSNAWLGIIGFNAAIRNQAFADLLDDGFIKPVSVEGFSRNFYIDHDNVGFLDFPSMTPQASVIAPLDNLIWDRRLVQDLFGFDYKWEVYTPAPMRKYGYYTLPVLYGDAFIARFEPKMEKKSGVLHIKNWWWEKNISLNNSVENALIDCFDAFRNFCGARRINYSGTETIHTNWLKSGSLVPPD